MPVIAQVHDLSISLLHDTLVTCDFHTYYTPLESNSMYACAALCMEVRQRFTADVPCHVYLAYEYCVLVASVAHHNWQNGQQSPPSLDCTFCGRGNYSVARAGG